MAVRALAEYHQWHPAPEYYLAGTQIVDIKSSSSDLFMGTPVGFTYFWCDHEFRLKWTNSCGTVCTVYLGKYKIRLIKVSDWTWKITVTPY